MVTDWAAKKEGVMAQAQAGFANSPGYGVNQVYMDLVVGTATDKPMRLVFQLFEQTPLAFANFFALCAHSITGCGEAGYLLTYKKSKVYRIVKGVCFEGGDITLGDGGGGDSLYGAAGFDSESFGLALKHDTAGLLSMVASRSGACQSRFRVSLGPTPSHDGSSAVIGRLVSGAMHLSTLESMPVDATDRPARPVTIVECGTVPGWSDVPPPMPSVGVREAKATLGTVGASADALRDSVASAVTAALGEAGDGGAADAGKGGGGGGGEGGRDSTKRAAAATDGMVAPPAAKRSAMMALPFEEEMGESDEDDED